MWPRLRLLALIVIDTAMEPIVQSNRAVTLLGGGELDLATLREALAVAPLLVAADGGANRAMALGHVPDAVVGDFDSIDPDVVARLPAARLHRIADQETTDFDKAVRSVAAPLLLALGFAGARLDHTLASFSTLARHPQQRCVLIGAECICCLAPPDLRLALPVGMRLSLFPMGPATGRSLGLQWPIDGLRFTPAGVIGTSNMVNAPIVRLRFDAPAMLLVLPLAARAQLMPALIAAPRWD